MKEIRDAYKAHVVRVLTLAGLSEPDKRAARIVDLETKIASVHATREESEDVKKGNNHWARADLAKKAPGLDWDAFLSVAQLDKQTTFVVWQPKALAGISALVKAAPLDAWEGLPRVPRDPGPRRVPAEGLRRRGLCLLRQDPERHPAAAGALEARHRRDRSRAR